MLGLHFVFGFCGFKILCAFMCFGQLTEFLRVTLVFVCVCYLGVIATLHFSAFVKLVPQSFCVFWCFRLLILAAGFG